MRGREDFLAHRIVDDPGEDFLFFPAPHRDRNAEVRDAVEIIHRAVQRIDDPLEFAVGISAHAFLAVDRVVGETREDDLRDEFLRALVEFEFDVVRGERIDVEFAAEIFAQQRTGGARGGHGGFKVIGHDGKCNRKTPRVVRVLRSVVTRAKKIRGRKRERLLPLSG